MAEVVNTDSSKRSRVEAEDPASTGGSKGNGKEGKTGEGKGKGQRYDLVLERVLHEYDEVYSYKFSTADSKPIVYKAGQWGHLLAPGAEMGRGAVHHMSFASTAEEGHYLFTMDVSSKSPYKQAFAAAKPGDKTVVFKIKGEFVIDPAEQQEVIFVAGGIGITPMRALIRDIVARDLPVSWSLIHVARSAHLYKTELESLTNAPQLRTNRVGVGEALAASVKEMPRAWYYVCGSQRFVDGVGQTLQDLGIAPERIRTENFKGGPQSAV